MNNGAIKQENDIREEKNSVIENCEALWVFSVKSITTGS